jgi:hypothetical protein
MNLPATEVKQKSKPRRTRNPTILHTKHAKVKKGCSNPSLPSNTDHKEKKRKSSPAIFDCSDTISDELQLDMKEVQKPRPTTFVRETTLTQRAASDFDYNDRHLLFNMTPNGPVILGGTKEKLTSLLTTPSVIEVRFTQEFLAVYHYFTTCQDVLESLWSAYFHTQIPTNIHENEKATYINKVRKRVVLVLIRWMENHPKDFYDANAILELTGLIGQIEDNDDKNRLMSLLKNVESFYSQYDFMTPRVVSDKIRSPLFSFSTTTLAQQLALLDQKQFCRIEWNELKGQKWTEDNSFRIAPNITRCIEFFNRISYWCATEIVSQQELKLRVKALRKFISIAWKCIKYQNYNTAFAIISSFSFASISRLKLTWNSLPEKYLTMVDELNDICGVERHYLPYKKALLTKTPPLVPYIGVFLRDLTFIEVGNPTYLDEEKTMINFEKFRMLAAVLEDLRSYQQVPYSFEQNRSVEAAFKHSILTLDPDELYNVSRIVEPSSISQSRKRRGSLVDSSKNILRSLKNSLA